MIKTVGGSPEPVLLGITPDGIVQFKVTPATLQGQFTDDDVQPAPAGVSGALLDDGAWLNTPAGWRLAFGALLVDGGSGGTFALTEICLPAKAVSPAPTVSSSPTATVSSSESTSPSSQAAATSSAPGAGGGGLPITGSGSGPLLLGGAVVAAGALLLLAFRRRREKIRFQA
ncbi:LPXTG-motif cell wall-anchored protein [Actinoplanes tereljensis]|uniref:LPXTG cell wall anchor domain-containing protein n=1 Tax=Paractinoplanes tereljensis TaxID=571912 RepID=UPI001940F4F0|nr:LPXTG cell wall anchor domain-containing protein [Actinoplanes tereljensis]